MQCDDRLTKYWFHQLSALSERGTREDAKKAEDLLQLLEKKYRETNDPDIKPNVRTYTSGTRFPYH